MTANFPKAFGNAVLRPFTLEDAPAKAILDADPEIRRYLGPPSRLEDDIAEFDRQGFGLVAIVNAVCGDIVGYAKLQRPEWKPGLGLDWSLQWQRLLAGKDLPPDHGHPLVDAKTAKQRLLDRSSLKQEPKMVKPREIGYLVLLALTAVSPFADAADPKIRVRSGGSLKEGTVQATPAMLATPPVAAPETLVNGVVLQAPTGKTCSETTLAAIEGWPETKAEMELQCIDLGILGRPCTNVPRIYGRSCKKNLLGQGCGPDTADATQAVKDCIAVGAGAGVLAGIGSPAAALPAFKVATEACLATKGATFLAQLELNVYERSECEGWHPI